MAAKKKLKKEKKVLVFDENSRRFVVWYCVFFNNLSLHLSKSSWKNILFKAVCSWSRFEIQGYVGCLEMAF